MAKHFFAIIYTTDEIVYMGFIINYIISSHSFMSDIGFHETE